MSCADIGTAAGILGDCYSVYNSNVNGTDPDKIQWKEIMFACSPTCSACPPAPCEDTAFFEDSFFDDSCSGWSDYFCTDLLFTEDPAASYLEPNPMEQAATTYINFLRNCPVSCETCDVFAGSSNSSPAGENPDELCYLASFDADADGTREEFESGQVEHMEHALWQR